MDAKERALVEKFIINAIMDHTIINKEDGTPALLDNVKDIDLNEDLNNYNISELDKVIIVAKTEEKFSFVDVDESKIGRIKTGMQIIALCLGDDVPFMDTEDNGPVDELKEDPEVEAATCNCTADNCSGTPECNCGEDCACNTEAEEQPTEEQNADETKSAKKKVKKKDK